MTADTKEIKKDGLTEEEIEKAAEDTAQSDESAGTEESSAADDPAKAAEADTERKDEAEKEETEDAERKYLRLMADFQNYKKRVEKEKSDLYSYANEKIVSELLEVIDNFERALEHDSGESAEAGFREGMEMIFKQMCNVLEKSGMEEIPALGEEFDPNIHNAVMTEETEKYESGRVSGVMQKGYTLNGKVIRPSMVKVSN